MIFIHILFFSPNHTLSEWLIRLARAKQHYAVRRAGRVWVPAVTPALSAGRRSRAAGGRSACPRVPPPGGPPSPALPGSPAGRGPAFRRPRRRPPRPAGGRAETQLGRGRAWWPGCEGPKLTMAEEPRARPQPRVTRRRQRPLSW